VIEDSIIEIKNILGRFDQVLFKNFEKLVKQSIKSLKYNGKIIFFGNGGSASDAEHLATELVIKFKKKRKSLPSIALSANTALITACANDYGYENIFSRQLESLMSPKDVIIGISTSGKSKNVLKALNYAKENGNFTCLFTGLAFKKNKYNSLIKVPSTVTSRIQECHIFLGHELISNIEKNLKC